MVSIECWDALENWPQAFQLLASLLPAAGWTVLLLDEISWMAMGEPDFAGHLKMAWDNLFSRHDRLVLVLCGAACWLAHIAAVRTALPMVAVHQPVQSASGWRHALC